MNHAPMRTLLSGLLGLFCTISVASANTDGTATGKLSDQTTLSFNHLYLHESNVKANTQPVHDPDSVYQYLNYAHCQCSIPGVAQKSPYYENVFSYLILLSSASSTIHQPLQIWTGTGCDDTVMRPMNCHQISSAGVTDIAAIGTVGVAPDVPIWELMNPEPLATGVAPSCMQRILSANEWAIADTMGAGTPDFFLAQSIATDSLPPPLPTNFRANGAENAIAIAWTAPASNQTDIYAYQALCAKASDGTPALASRSNDPRYFTARNLCGATIDGADVALTTSVITVASTGSGSDGSADAAVDAAVDDGGTPIVTIPAALRQLDPSYICGEVQSQTATSMRIDGLANGVAYNVVVLTIDRSGNATGTVFDKTLTPQPVTDFWEDLHDKGDDIQGGFCLIADTYGDNNPLTKTLRAFRDNTLADSAYGRWLSRAYYATLAPLGQYVQGHLTLRILSGIILVPVVALALLWHLLTLPGLVLVFAIIYVRRRMMKSRLGSQTAAAATLALVLLSSGHARAQSPYWEDQTTGTDTDAPHISGDVDVMWHVSLGLGPYTPAIDSQTAVRNSGGQGPYQAMFGGYELMPTLAVDRFLWTGFGQLGVGLSVGYMGKTAHAYTLGSDPMAVDRERSPGDETSFRMLPFQLTAVYRFSYLDDDYGIPIIPYVRGGFGYYVWWATAPDGSFSSAPKDSGNKARGATDGLVGAVGIAIRAERIDANAARSMHESGLEHAGFFGEVNAGWVDGFGRSQKLDVGATTWFAGIDFEF